MENTLKKVIPLPPELLDRPIAYHRIFVRIAGSVTAAVMLSQACYWSLRTTIDGKWFYKTHYEWEEETGLSRREIDSARTRLLQIGVIEYKLAGIPAKSHYRVKYDVLQTIIASSLAENAKLACAKPPNLCGENSQTITENTSENTPEKTNTRVPKKSKKKQDENQSQAVQQSQVEQQSLFSHAKGTEVTGEAEGQNQANPPPAATLPADPDPVSPAEVTTEPKVTPVGFTSVTLVHLDGTPIDFNNPRDPAFSIDATPDPLDDPAMGEQEKPDPVMQNLNPVLPTPVSSAAEKFKERTLAAMGRFEPYMDASGLNVLDLSKYPEDVKGTIAIVCQLWNLSLPSSKSTVSFWIKEGRELMTSCGTVGTEAIKEVHKDYKKRMAEKGGLPPYDVTSPKSLVNVARGMAGRMREKGQKKADENVLDTVGTFKENGFFY
jgi:hypothetical protein